MITDECRCILTRLRKLFKLCTAGELAAEQIIISDVKLNVRLRNRSNEKKKLCSQGEDNALSWLTKAAMWA